MALSEIQLTADVVLQNQTTFERQIRDLERKALASMRVGGGQPLGRLTAKVTEFDKSLEAANARVVAFGASAAVIAAVSTAIKEMVTQTLKVEKSLTDINVLLNLSNTSLAKFGDDLFTIAKQTGQSFDEVAKAATEFSRQGLSVEATLKSTNAALVLTRLSGLDAAKAVEALTATINSFNKEALTQNDIVNRLAAVDARFAVSTADLAEGLSRSGNAAQDAGVSLNELIALITSAQQRTARGGAVIGNALKSILSRTSRAGTLDELEKVGVAVRDLSGNTLPAVQILSSLAKTYDTLGDSQKTFVAELVGGVYQINILKSYIGDLAKENSIYAQALRAASSAQDEAFDRNAELNKTLAATANAAQQNFTRMAAVLGSDIFGPALKTVFGQFNEISDMFSKKSKDGEEQGGNYGEKFGHGIIKGIGNALAGPGLIFGTLIGTKLATQFVRFTTEAIAGVAGISRASERVLEVQRGITQLMAQQPELENIILSRTTSLAEKEAALLAVLRQQIAAKRELAAVTEAVSVAAVNAGVRFNPRTDTFKTKASGHLPVSSIPSEAVMAEVAGARKAGYSITPDNVRAMKAVIDGKATTVVYNNRERVIHDFNGSGEPAIIPPNKTIGQLINRPNGFVPYGKIPVNKGEFRGLSKVPHAEKAIYALSDFLSKNLGMTKKQIAPITFEPFAKEANLADFALGGYRKATNQTEIYFENMLQYISRRHGGAIEGNKDLIMRDFSRQMGNTIVHEGFHNAYAHMPEKVTKKFGLLADKSFVIPKSNDEALEFIAKKYFKGDVAKAQEIYGTLPIEETLALQFPRLLGFPAGRVPKVKLGGRAEYARDGNKLGYAEYKKSKDTLVLDTVATYLDAQGNRPQGTGVLDFAFKELLNRGKEGGVPYVGFTPMNSRVVQKAQKLFGEVDAFGKPIAFGKASKIKVSDFEGLFAASGMSPLGDDIVRINLPRPTPPGGVNLSKQITKRPKTLLEKAKDVAYGVANKVTMNTHKVLDNPLVDLFGDDVIRGAGSLFGFAGGYVNAAGGMFDGIREKDILNWLGMRPDASADLPPGDAPDPSKRDPKTEQARLTEVLRKMEANTPSPAAGQSFYNRDKGGQQIIGGPHFMSQEEFNNRNAVARLKHQLNEGRDAKRAARAALRSAMPQDRLLTRQIAMGAAATPESRLDILRQSILSVPDNEARAVYNRSQRTQAQIAAAAQQNASLDAKLAAREARRSLGSTDVLANRQARLDASSAGLTNPDDVTFARTSALKQELLAKRTGLDRIDRKTGLEYGVRDQLVRKYGTTLGEELYQTGIENTKARDTATPKKPAFLSRARQALSEGRGRSVEFLRNGFQYKDQAFAAKIGSIGMTASFAAPLAGAAIGNLFSNPNDPTSAGNRVARAAGEATSAIGTGAAFAAIGGPAGAAVGGLVAAFGTLKAVVNNLTPSLEDMEQVIAKRTEQRNENTGALQNFALANEGVSNLLAKGASKMEVSQALSRRAEAFTGLSEENKKSLNGDFSQKNVERVIRESAADDAKAVLNDKSLQSIYQSEAANTNSIGIKQSSIDAAASGLFGEFGKNTLDSLRNYAVTNKDNPLTTGLISSLLIGGGDKNKDSVISKKLINGIDLSKLDAGELRNALGDVARLTNSAPEEAADQLASVAGRAGINMETVNELIAKRGSGDATTIVGDAIVQLQNTLRDFEPILKEQQKQARKIEGADVRRNRESLATGSIRNIETSGFFRGIRNEFMAAFNNNIANARNSLSSQAFDGSSQYITEFSKTRGENARQIDEINSNLADQLKQIEDKRLDSLDGLAGRSINAALSVDSIKNSLLGDSSDRNRSQITKIADSFAGGNVSESGLIDLRKAVGAELNNKSVSDEVKDKLAASANEIDSILGEYKKTNEAARQQSGNQKLLAEQSRSIAREAAKLQSEIARQRQLASLFDFEKLLGGVRDTSSISKFSAAQARGLEMNRAARNGTDMRRFTKAGREEIRQDRQGVLIDAADGVLNQFKDGFAPKRDQIRAMLEANGTLKTDSEFDKDEALKSKFKNYQEYSSSVIDNSDMGKQLAQQRAVLERGFAASGLRDIRSATSQYAGDFLDNFNKFGKLNGSQATVDFQRQFDAARQSGDIGQLQKLAGQLNGISNTDGQSLIQQFIQQLGTQSQYERNVTTQAKYKSMEVTGGVEADALTNANFNAKMADLLKAFEKLNQTPKGAPEVKADIRVEIKAQGVSAEDVAQQVQKITGEQLAKITRDLNNVTEWAKENGHRPPPQPNK